MDGGLGRLRGKAPERDIFLLCNPHNPLGIVWTEEELRRMMELCLKHHVLVVSDEIHSDLIFHGKRHIPTASLSPEIAANVVTGISATKTFNLAGLQASTAVFPNAHMKAMFDRSDRHGYPPQQRLLNHRHGGGLQ